MRKSSTARSTLFEPKSRNACAVVEATRTFHSLPLNCWASDWIKSMNSESSSTNRMVFFDMFTNSLVAPYQEPGPGHQPASGLESLRSSDSSAVRAWELTHL